MKRQKILFIYTVTTMHFDIRRMRNKGRPLKRREFDKLQPFRGDVYIRHDARTPLKRVSLIAEILKVGPSAPTLPTLYDVAIHGMATNGLVITGYEFIDGIAYAQSWHCRTT